MTLTAARPTWHTDPQLRSIAEATVELLGDYATVTNVAALSTRATVCVAPSLPPRSKGNPIVEETLRLLREPDNFVVFDPVPGPSESSDIDHAWIPPAFPDVLRQLEQRRAALETQTSPRTA